MINRGSCKAFFINFDTPKLYNFDINDFEILDSVIADSKAHKLYFDEIQVVEGWELYVRQKLDEGFQVVVTGSNASLLSHELGTKLTGRHISKELYPFSYNEFMEFKRLKPNNESFKMYFKNGGFPEFLKRDNPEILTSLFDDVLFRDIAVRHGIRDIKSLQRLLLYLTANIGNLVTAGRLTTVLNTETVNEKKMDYWQPWIILK